MNHLSNFLKAASAALLAMCIVFSGCGKDDNDQTTSETGDKMSGSVSIMGTPQLNAILHVDVENVITDNYEGGGHFICHWQRVSDPQSDDGVVVGDDFNYTVTAADVGNYIKVTVTISNYPGSLTSEAFGKISAIPVINSRAAGLALADDIIKIISDCSEHSSYVGGKVIYRYSGSLELTDYSYVNDYNIYTEYRKIENEFDFTFDDFSWYGANPFKFKTGTGHFKYDAFESPYGSAVMSKWNTRITIYSDVEYVYTYNDVEYQGTLTYLRYDKNDTEWSWATSLSITVDGYNFSRP